MAERQKRPKRVFRKFLDENKKGLENFNKSKGEKYVREPWMLKARPATERAVETEVEDGQGGN